MKRLLSSFLHESEDKKIMYFNKIVFFKIHSKLEVLGVERESTALNKQKLKASSYSSPGLNLFIVALLVKTCMLNSDQSNTKLKLMSDNFPTIIKHMQY